MNFENEHIAIYELNNKSVLFARVAAEYISKGETEKAKEILLQGIEEFEDYPTPYFLYGDILLQSGEYKAAKEYFEKGSLLLNDSGTLEFYLSKIPFEESVEVEEEAETLPPSESFSDEENVPMEPNGNNDEEDEEEELEELADKLQTAKIEVNYDELPPIPEDSEGNDTEEFKPVRGLVSETLATIYFNQSNYKEAKAIYETLIEIQPERKEYFMGKIREVEARMRPRKTDE